MILKKVLLVPVEYDASIEKGMITNKGYVIHSDEESCYVANRIDGDQSGGCQEWWNHEVKPVKFQLVDSEQKVIATPDQLAIISRQASDGIDSGDAPSTERTITYNINNETIQEILDDDGECEIELENKHKNHASGLEPTGHPLMDMQVLENYEPKLVNGKVIIHL